MTYSADMRWRIATLHHIYDLDYQFLSDIFGPKKRTIGRWYNWFLKPGEVLPTKVHKTKSRWPPDVLEHVQKYCDNHPTFYLEEL